MTTPTPNKPNKKLFYNDLMRVFEIITEICEAHTGTDGLYLESSLLIKKLYDWNNYIKNDTNFNRNIETLSRCRNPMSFSRMSATMKITCNRCGRQVVNLEAHQKRDICVDIEKEKKFSNQFKTDGSIIKMTIAIRIIRDFYRKYKTRSGAGI